ncbi:MAG: helix-turn-helix domain-containing protein [Nitrospirae bacterium]|nr:helix-turn-helix domain-containing protein [Nitrospirota bacterium]
MESIGEYLQRIRRERGLSIEQVADKTRISPIYIRALEENRLDKFPGEVFARGFVRVYGRCLGLDDPDTMARFTQSAQSFFRERDENKRTTEQSAEQEKGRKEFRGRIVQAAVVAALALAVLTVYGINTKRSSDTDEVVEPVARPPAVSAPETPPLSDLPPIVTEQAVNKPMLREEDSKSKPGPILPMPSKPAVTQPAASVSQRTAPVSRRTTTAPVNKPAEKLPAAVNVPGQTPAPSAETGELVLVIEAVEASWVSAKIDEGDTKEVFLEPGEKVTWKASDHFLLSFGNAGGVKVRFNGKPIPPFGAKGAVVKNIKLKRE